METDTHGGPLRDHLVSKFYTFAFWDDWERPMP
jgi:hypothetical protein